jgi:hypothetical protein
MIFKNRLFREGSAFHHSKILSFPSTHQKPQIKHLYNKETNNFVSFSEDGIFIL